jgi:hypothetical protein
MTGHQLAAVADPEDRDPERKDRIINIRCVQFIYASGTAGENDPYRIKGTDTVDIRIIRPDLAVYTAFPDTPGDQLVILASEIKDQYALSHFTMLPISHLKSKKSSERADFPLHGTPLFV